MCIDIILIMFDVSWWQDFTLKFSNFIQIQKKLIFEDSSVYVTEKLFIVLFAHIRHKKMNFEKKVEKKVVIFFNFLYI